MSPFFIYALCHLINGGSNSVYKQIRSAILPPKKNSLRHLPPMSPSSKQSESQSGRLSPLSKQVIAYVPTSNDRNPQLVQSCEHNFKLASSVELSDAIIELQPTLP